MHKSKAALFLMELLIVLLFFSIAGAICLRLFSDAHLTNKKSNHLSDANILLTNNAEVFYNTDFAELSAGESFNYYNEWLMDCDIEDAAYTVSSSLCIEDNYYKNHLLITLSSEDDILLEQDLIRYKRKELP